MIASRAKSQPSAGSEHRQQRRRRSIMGPGPPILPEVLRTGYLMRKSTFLKRWYKQYCVLDRFSLQCFDTEQAKQDGNQPNDVLKLDGASVYNGGQSLTMKAPRLQISTDDGRHHCFSSRDKAVVNDWMKELVSAVEYLRTHVGLFTSSSVDASAAAQARRSTAIRGLEATGDGVGPDGVATMHFVASQRRASLGSGSSPIRSSQYARRTQLGMPLQRTVSQYMTAVHDNSMSHLNITSFKKQRDLVRGSPARHLNDSHKWYRVMASAQSKFRRTLGISTNGIVSRSPLPWNLIGILDGKLKVEFTEVISENLPCRKIFKATCIMRAAPETIARVLLDAKTRGMWDAQFPMANVLDTIMGVEKSREGTLISPTSSQKNEPASTLPNTAPSAGSPLQGQSATSVAASVVHLQSSAGWSSLGICDSAVESCTGLLAQEMKFAIGCNVFARLKICNGPILFMLCIAAGAVAGTLLFNFEIIMVKQTILAFLKTDVELGAPLNEVSNVCEGNSCYDTVEPPFFNRFMNAFVSFIFSGSAIGAALASIILNWCRMSQKIVQSHLKNDISIPRDLCVLQTVQRVSKNGKSNLITITEASFESVRCPKMQGFVRAQNGPGAGFQLEGISFNGWPASRVTMVSDFDPTHVDSTTAQTQCLDRLSVLASLAGFISGSVESWSERVRIHSKQGQNDSAKRNDINGGKVHVEVCGAQKITEANEYDDDSEGDEQNDVDAIVVVRERVVTLSSDSPISLDETVREGPDVLRYQRCWDRRRGSSSWMLLPPASSVSANFSKTSASVHYPWLHVLEESRIERKMQNKKMQWYVRKSDLLLQEEYDEDLTDVHVDRHKQIESAHPRYRTYVDPLGFIHGSNQDDVDESITRKLNFGQLPLRKWDPYAWMGGLTRVATGGLKGTAPTSLGASIKGMFRRPIGEIFGDFVSSSSTTISEAVLPPEPCSRLERFARSWVYAPKFLTLAAIASDPVKRFEFVMAFAVAGLHFGAMPTRPFEPLLGETLQAALSDGSQIYCEQISLEPSKFAFEVVSKAMRKSKRKRRKIAVIEKAGSIQKLGKISVATNSAPPLNLDAKPMVGSGSDLSDSDYGSQSDSAEYLYSNSSNEQVSDEEYSNETRKLKTVVKDFEPKSDSDGSVESSSDSDCDDADSLYLNKSERQRIRERRILRREARKESRRLKAEREAWTISGQLENEMQYTLKSWNTLQKGTIRVSFHDGFVDYTMPQVQLTGVVLGDRVTEVVGEMRFTDVANGLECVLRFNPNRKAGVEGMFQGKTVSDQFRGTIVKKSGKRKTVLSASVNKKAPAIAAAVASVATKSVNTSEEGSSGVVLEYVTSGGEISQSQDTPENDSLQTPLRRIRSASDASVLNIARKKLAEGIITKDEFGAVMRAHNETRSAENLNQSSMHDQSGFDNFSSEKVGTVEGSWLDNFVCVGDREGDKRTIWNMHRDRPSELLFEQQFLDGEILPSDSRNRKDIHVLMDKGDISAANQANAELIESQNKDEKMRAVGRPAETLIKSFF